jgi:hypothetical protein|tara:strand:- start:2361 stop:2537 length:177 start_codon:yes stop_codon:yes gene_type:complete
MTKIPKRGWKKGLNFLVIGVLFSSLFFVFLKLLFFVEQPQLARDNKDESGRSSPYVKE